LLAQQNILTWGDDGAIKQCKALKVTCMHFSVYN